MDYLDHLNPPQREAVLHKDGPVLVVAGAGAGKTRTLVYRIHHLVKSGVAPETILAVTFTNKAANEMRGRIRTLLGLEKDTFSPLTPFSPSPLTPFSPFSFVNQPFIGTFHALGIKILREKGGEIGIPKNFVIKDRDGALALIKEAMDEVSCDKKQFEPRKVQNIISREKGDLSSPDDYLDKKSGGYGAQKIAAVWQAYEKMLKKEKACDFDDLLLKPVFLLQTKKEARDYFRDKWRYIHIDEYQDTNRAQYVLSNLLAEPRNNICAVGDVDQNIYGWRGSSIRNILQFEKDYPKTKIVMLEENYRSTARIIRAANEIIGKNQLRIEKNLFTKNDEGEKISLFVSPDEKTEAFRVAHRAKALAESGAQREDMAVLYRANFQSRALEEAFLALDVPYQVIGTRFFERKEVKDILAFLNAARNPDSLGDIKRVINVPPRGIGKTTIAKVFSGMRDSLPQAVRARVNDFYSFLARIDAASREISVADLVLFIFKESGLEAALKKEGEEGAERIMNIQELMTLAKRYDTLSKENALDTFLEDTALLSGEDSEKEKKGGVRLMTVHAAKGLEFPYVFITGLEDGLFPHESFSSASEKGGLSEKERAEEERRLFYVAVTRAAKKLFLSYAETRTVFGSRGYNTPSPFIGDIPEDLLEYELGDEAGAEEIIKF
ncbi:MAG: UvrD-helicase domain-containing protein [Parcubacteria group bacterium]|nr:UvrD-helicase domain-containing protein [Parcubacteria group bacterium]